MFDTFHNIAIAITIKSKFTVIKASSCNHLPEQFLLSMLSILKKFKLTLIYLNVFHNTYSKFCTIKNFCAVTNKFCAEKTLQNLSLSNAEFLQNKCRIQVKISAEKPGDRIMETQTNIFCHILAMIYICSIVVLDEYWRMRISCHTIMCAA